MEVASREMCETIMRNYEVIWTIPLEDNRILGRAEMRMLRLMCVIRLHDQVTDADFWQR